MIHNIMNKANTTIQKSKCQINNEYYSNQLDKIIKIQKTIRGFLFHLRLVHGAIRCKTCLVRWNRDCNGATNIYKIAKNAINKKLRPSYLTRSNTSGVLDDTLKT